VTAPVSDISIFLSICPYVRLCTYAYYICMYNTYICMHVCLFVPLGRRVNQIDRQIYICIYIYIYIYIYINIYIYIYIYLKFVQGVRQAEELLLALGLTRYIFIYMYSVCVCLCTYIYMYMYIYTYIHIDVFIPEVRRGRPTNGGTPSPPRNGRSSRRAVRWGAPRYPPRR